MVVDLIRQRLHLVAFAVLLAASVLLLGREALLQLGEAGQPLRARQVGADERVTWNDARWQLRDLRIVDPADLKLESWEEPIELIEGTRLITIRLVLAPSRAFVREEGRSCAVELRTPDGRRWAPDVLVPSAATAETASCGATADGEDLRPGGEYDLRPTFLIPDDVDIDDLTVEVRLPERSLEYLRFKMP